MKIPISARILHCRSGGVAIQVALLLTVLLGMVALGTELTFAMFKQRQMQSVADSAALGGAVALAAGSDHVLESRAIAASAGFVHGVAGATVTVSYPPVSGRYAGQSGAVQVAVKQPQILSMISLFRTGDFNVAAAAVALLGGAGGFCVLQLSPANFTGVPISNGAEVVLGQCGLAVNATGSSALSVTGGATLNALSVSVAGNTTVSNGGAINATNGVKNSQPAVTDPYAGVAEPSYSGCAFTNKSVGYSSARQYLSPGVYCNGLSFGNAAIVTMNPGVYVIDRGTFDVGGGVQLTGTGVTIFLTSSKSSSYAKVSIGNGATVDVTAPNSGAMSGLLFFGDRDAPLSNTHNFAGGVALDFTGAVYFPTQTVRLSNGVSNPSGCTQLIAAKIEFTGGSNFKNGCSGTGIAAIGGSNSVLAE